MAIFGLLAGTPLMWQVPQVSGRWTPSWQRAQMDILFCEVLEMAGRVPGWLMLAWHVRHWYPACRKPLWLTRMLPTTMSFSICELGWHWVQLASPT